MCTKEIAALTTVLVLGLCTCFSMVSLAGFMEWIQPRDVPAKSPLGDWDWKAEFGPQNITQGMLNDWELHGYHVFRQAVDPKAIQLLLQDAKRLCRYQFMVSRVCQIEESRWQSDLVRDFLFYSGVGALADRLVRDSRHPPLRVYQDGIVGVKSSWFTPLFFTFTKHVDHGGMPGVWHGLHSDTQGVGLWIPLVDIDPNVTGGGIELYDKFPTRGCQLLWGEKSTVDGFENAINMTKVATQCQQYKEDDTLKPAVKPGDIVAWWPQMLHKTQPIKQKGFERYALYVRLVMNETMVCMQKDCGWKGRPCCAGKLPKSGTMIDTPCYPQVFPAPLEREVKAHFSKRPQPLLDRNRMESKYSKDVWSSMHPVCKKHRGAGPGRFWQAVKNDAPLPERSRPQTVNASVVFGCHVEELEGECWRLEQKEFNISLVHWTQWNFTSYGAPFFFSKDYEDLELMYRIPWGGTIKGVKEEGMWIKVGDYYVVDNFFGSRLVPADEQAAETDKAAAAGEAAEAVGEAAAAAPASATETDAAAAAGVAAETGGEASAAAPASATETDAAAAAGEAAEAGGEPAGAEDKPSPPAPKPSDEL